MTREDLEQLLIKNFNLSVDSLKNLFKYYELISKYNKVMNLTALVTLDDIYIKHFYDALLITKTIGFNTKGNLLDIGTGAGIPGLVLKICFPDLQVSLLDSTEKKCEFLRTVIKELNLQGVKVISSRAEEYAESAKESYDIVTSRAVARLNILDELAIPFVKLNGYFISYKSKETSEEVKEASKGITTLGGFIQNTFKFSLLNGDERTFVEIKKIKKTPSQYPRIYAKIKKNPL